uniref:SGNH hydrolase-type esterase domain-containing protein n=1 Tax=Knipowitschia caucasica TaxID=637954 RepID=A0AAV2MIJ8_KNICA
MMTHKQRFRRIVIHAGGNDVRRKQSEVLKLQVAAVCKLASTMADTVIFSGPLPSTSSAEAFSRHSAFNRWLSGWCPRSGVVHVDNWSAFWGKPGLIRSDDIHPTLAGTSLLAKNLALALNCSARLK